MPEKTVAHDELVQALREVLTEGEQSEKAMLIKRIPFICNDIRDIKNSLWWQSRIAGVVGTVVLTLLAAYISALQGVHL